jgi:hypothetical protein
LQQSGQEVVDASRETTVAESLAHGPYRQTSTPITVPMRRKQPHESRLEQLQHDDDDAARFEYDDRLFREDRFGGGS